MSKVNVQVVKESMAKAVFSGYSAPLLSTQARNAWGFLASRTMGTPRNQPTAARNSTKMPTAASQTAF